MGLDVTGPSRQNLLCGIINYTLKVLPILKSNQCGIEIKVGFGFLAKPSK